jgi:hypothetical protein
LFWFFFFFFCLKSALPARCQWLTPVILATQEAEIRRIPIRSQHREIVHKTLSQKNLPLKRAGAVVQGVSPKFKPQFCKNKTKKKRVSYLDSLLDSVGWYQKLGQAILTLSSSQIIFFTSVWQNSGGLLLNFHQLLKVITGFFQKRCLWLNYVGLQRDCSQVFKRHDQCASVNQSPALAIPLMNMNIRV